MPAPTFDEQGNTIQNSDPNPEFENPNPPETEVPEAPETPEGEPEGEPGETLETPETPGEPEVPQEASGKYRIGDKTFQTMEEAHEYAVSQVNALQTEAQIADAYRQGIRDAATRGESPQEVTQNAEAEPEDDFDEEKYFANPKEFLKEFKQKIKTETQAEYDARMAQKAQSDKIWNEFSERHPALADFRKEAESFVAKNSDSVRAIIATKGQTAGYDYIALKLREEFSRYEKALRPSRKLPNTSKGPSPAGSKKSVTQKEKPKKPMTLAEQIRSIKRRR